MEYWVGVESNLGVAKKVLHMQIPFRQRAFYGLESWCGVLEEYWSGGESDFGVAKVEWSAFVTCVCV